MGAVRLIRLLPGRLFKHVSNIVQTSFSLFHIFGGFRNRIKKKDFNNFLSSLRAPFSRYLWAFWSKSFRPSSPPPTSCPGTSRLMMKIEGEGLSVRVPGDFLSILENLEHTQLCSVRFLRYSRKVKLYSRISGLLPFHFTELNGGLLASIIVILLPNH